MGEVEKEIEDRVENFAFFSFIFELFKSSFGPVPVPGKEREKKTCFLWRNSVLRL